MDLFRWDIDPDFYQIGCLIFGNHRFYGVGVAVGSSDLGAELSQEHMMIRYQNSGSVNKKPGTEIGDIVVYIITSSIQYDVIT